MGGRPDLRPEPTTTVARSIADVLSNQVRFEVECIDRMYLNVYQPKLQYRPARSSTCTSNWPYRSLHRRDGPVRPVRGIPWVDFTKGQRKDDVMAQRLAKFIATEGVVSSAGRRKRPPCSGRKNGVIRLIRTSRHPMSIGVRRRVPLQFA